MARLPKRGEYDWADVLNEYLSQALDSDGTLVSGPTNPFHGGPNTNLASNSRAGLVRLTNDLSGSASTPQVTGLQGNPVSSNQPKNNQALVWDEATGTWVPKTITIASTPGLAATHARAMAINSVGL